MLTDLESIPQKCLEVMKIRPLRYLGGRVNRHWLVESSESSDRKLVLQAYCGEQITGAAYEHEVLRRLHRLAWPVPEIVAPPTPLYESGELWVLFTFLPGSPKVENKPEDRRARGRLLARLHQSTRTLVDLGQRPSFCMADQVVNDPALADAIRDFETVRPAEAHMMRWHLEKAIEGFTNVDRNKADVLVLHGDFAPWNILYNDSKLSGLIDFEATHLNYRVSDFALAWRGHQDEVIQGYEEEHPLSSFDRQMIIPCYWSWLFLGVKDEIGRIKNGAPIHGFDWQIRHFLMRSKFLNIMPYPGPKPIVITGE
ncbi:MAG: aminoglycoside phosphotransferase family protein [Phycisphaerales bacterium]|nr:aminoglycoside phosphotransferase family protein [Phycisphaerales bacterium]